MTLLLKYNNIIKYFRCVHLSILIFLMTFIDWINLFLYYTSLLFRLFVTDLMYILGVLQQNSPLLMFLMVLVVNNFNFIHQRLFLAIPYTILYQLLNIIISITKILLVRIHAYQIRTIYFQLLFQVFYGLLLPIWLTFPLIVNLIHKI